MRKLITLTVTVAVVCATSASARRAQDNGTPQSVDKLLACRQVADSAARLACYDGEIAKVATSLASKDLVVIDRERARAAGRSLFGFSIPNFGGLLGSGGDVQSIDGKVSAVARNSDGGWMLQLDDGSSWSQTDDSILGLPPRKGDTVRVKRGVMGSFFLSVGGQPAMKAKRVG